MTNLILFEVPRNPPPTPNPWYRAGGAPVPIAAYQAKGAGSLAASYVNLINPGTFDLTAPAGDPIFDASGWLFDGSFYLSTGIIIDSPNWTVIGQFTGAQGGNFALLGEGGDSVDFSALYIKHNFFSHATVCYASDQSITASIGVGLVSGNIAIAGNTGYRNGVEPGTAIPNGFTAAAVELFLAAINVEGTPQRTFRGSIVAVAIYNTNANHALWVPSVAGAMAGL